MSFRFNPISLLNRRSSKAKAKKRSESADQTSLRSVDDENEEYIRKPRIIVRPSKPATSEQAQSTSLRAQVLASLRRARSPRRRKHQKEEQLPRAISVPPAPAAPAPVPAAVDPVPDSAQIIPHYETSDPTSKHTECTSPAPLAKHDSYESTDTVYIEPHFHLQKPIEQASTSTVGDYSPNFVPSYTEEECATPKGAQSTEDLACTRIQTDYSVEIPDPESHEKSDWEEGNKELESEGMMSSEFGDDSDEDDDTTEIEVNVTDDDRSVAKLSVEYETEYPVLDQIDDALSDYMAPEHHLAGNFYFIQDEDATPQPSDSEMSSSTPVSFREDMDDEDDATMPSETELAEFPSNAAPNEETTEDIDTQQAQDTQDTDHQYESNDQTDYTQPIGVDPLAPRFEVESDPEQDPFHAVETAAFSTSEWNTNYLGTPSIIVTSASSGSLREMASKDTYEPPSRPPPPSPTTTPKRPSQPPAVPPCPPPRPDHTPSPAPTDSKKKRKKDKLFGIVDLGPLPSDPDPNFPFRRHFEKSILPNPKKAIQRIVRGETKAERRKRKEQAELNRLLKSADPKPVAPDKAQVHSKEWEEFQALTARIQSTVEESASRIQALASVIEPEKSADSENWADFDGAFAQSSETQSEQQQQQPTPHKLEDNLVSITDSSLVRPVENFEPDWDQAFAKTDIAPDLPETEQEWNTLAQSDQSILEVEGLPLSGFVPDWDIANQSNSNQDWASQSRISDRSVNDLGAKSDSIDHWNPLFPDSHPELPNTTCFVRKPGEELLVKPAEPDHVQLQPELTASSNTDFVDDWDTVFQTNKPTLSNSPSDLNQTSNNQPSLQNDDWNSIVQKSERTCPQHDLQFESDNFVDNWDSIFATGSSSGVTESQPKVDQSSDWNALVQVSESKTEQSDQPSEFANDWEAVFSAPPSGSATTTVLEFDPKSEHLISREDKNTEDLTTQPTEPSSLADCPVTDQDFRLGGDRSSLSPVHQQISTHSAADTQPDSNCQAVADGWDSSLVYSDLQIEPNFGDSGQQIKSTLDQQINDFLGLTEDKLNQTEPILVSDPLKLLEQLKPKPQLDFLADLGIEIMNPVKMDVHQTEVDRSNDDGLGLEQREGYRYDDDDDAGVRDTVIGQIGEEDSSSSSVNSSVELNDAEDTAPTQGFDQPETFEQPEQEENIHIDVPGNQTFESVPETDNPFTQDTFGTKPNTTATASQFQKFNTEELKSVARPRAKPVRQETLSGNNPFRRKTSEEQTTSDDELAIAAAGIDLVQVKKIGTRIRDSFESGDSNEDHVDGAPVLATETACDGNLDKSGFDPLQTIYPESDNDDSGSDRGEHAIRVTIKKEQEHKPKLDQSNLAKVPLIQAPPPRPPTSSVVETPSQPEENGLDEENFSDHVPEGWVTFAEDTFEPSTEPTPDVDIIERAFEVTWDTKPDPQRRESELEPVRPDTPDPELDIPFHPPPDPNGQWRLWLRYPEKKTRVKQVSKYTTDRYWREVMVTFSEEHDRKVICLHEVNEQTNEASPTPYRTIRIEPYMQLSREKMQQYDKYGKVHVFKLNHVSYKELVGIRPEKFSIKNLQHLVTHKPKQNVAVDHLPIYSEVLKFGSLDQNRIRTLMPVFEDALMSIPSHKDATLNYNKEEVCCYVIDEYLGKLSSSGSILEQKARTRIFCTAFVNGGPHLVLGLNDKWRYGREVVRRSDILPVMHDEWISIRNPEFHSCVQMDEYEKDHMLKFYPLDGCRFELLRFRVSLRSNRELPMQIRTTYSIDGRRVSMRCDLLVPGFFSASKRSGAVPCEDVEIHIPVPEEWIYHFRVEKHHKYGSVHSTLRKPGKIKGLERITQMAQSLLPPSILEASIGLAKYEHLYKAIVWRIPRVPDKSEASFRPHLLSCNLVLAQHDNVPEWDTLVPDCQVEYTMPSSTVSGATVRSISVESSEVVEKFVKYTTKYKYSVEIDYQLGARKEPVLKSLLDESGETISKADKDSTLYEVDKYEEEMDEADTTTGPVNPASNQDEPVLGEEGQVVDLLGLGDEFFPNSSASPSHNPDQSASKPPINTIEDLL